MKKGKKVSVKRRTHTVLSHIRSPFVLFLLLVLVGLGVIAALLLPLAF